MPPSLQGGNDTDWSKPGRFTTSSRHRDIWRLTEAGSKPSWQAFVPSQAEAVVVLSDLSLGQAGPQMVASSGKARTSDGPEAICHLCPLQQSMACLWVTGLAAGTHRT